VKATRVPNTLRQVFRRRLLLSDNKYVILFVIFDRRFVFPVVHFIKKAYTESSSTILFSSYISGHELGITLWGESAIRFNGESVHFMGQTDPAVVIFVGTTVCMYEGD
jgi:hypothetical protein